MSEHARPEAAKFCLAASFPNFLNFYYESPGVKEIRRFPSEKQPVLCTSWPIIREAAHTWIINNTTLHWLQNEANEVTSRITLNDFIMRGQTVVRGQLSEGCFGFFLLTAAGKSHQKANWVNCHSFAELCTLNTRTHTLKTHFFGFVLHRVHAAETVDWMLLSLCQCTLDRFSSVLKTLLHVQIISLRLCSIWEKKQNKTVKPTRSPPKKKSCTCTCNSHVSEQEKPGSKAAHSLSVSLCLCL